jgi:hypothetical protein
LACPARGTQSTADARRRADVKGTTWKKGPLLAIAALRHYSGALQAEFAAIVKDKGGAGNRQFWEGVARSCAFKEDFKLAVRASLVRRLQPVGQLIDELAHR